MFQMERLKMLQIWGVLVLVFALSTACGDDEGTKKTEEEKKKEEAKKKEDDKKKMSVTDKAIKDSKLYKDLEKKGKDDAKKIDDKLKVAQGKLDKLRKKNMIYVWALAANPSTGDLAGASRAALDTTCSTAVLAGGKPPDKIVNHTGGDATHVTKSLILSHHVNNFRALGGIAVGSGANPLSIAMDSVWGISTDGATKKQLADTYEDFYEKPWMNTLDEAGVNKDNIAGNNAYWLGGAANGALLANNTLGSCTNFTSADDGAVAANTATHVATTAAIVQNSVKIVNNTSPLKAFQGAPNAVVAEGTTWNGCDLTAKRLCISFPKK